MSDADDDFIPTETSADSPSAQNLPRRSSRAINEVVPARSAKKPRNITTTKRTQILTNLRSVSALKKTLSKQLKGTYITESLSLRICRAALLMQEDYLLEKRKCSTQNGRTSNRPKFNNASASFWGYRHQLTAPSFLAGKYGNGRSGNSLAKDTRIPDTKAVRIRVREFVRVKRGNRERVTGRQVLDFLVAEGSIVMETVEEGVVDPKAFALVDNTTSTPPWTLELVYQRLVAEFDRVLTSGHDTVAGMIEKCAEISSKFYQEMEVDDVDEEDDEGSVSNDDDNDASDGDDVLEPPPEQVDESWTRMEEV